MTRLSHPNILKIKTVLYNRTDQNIYLVLEYAACGSLESWIGPMFPDAAVRSLFYQVLQGLLYLHNQGIVHQDIKPSNILFTADGRALISDFGVGHSFGSTDMVVGSAAFQAPEVLSESSGQDPAKEDIWSIGVSLFESLFHTLPFEGENLWEVIGTITTGKLVLPPECDPVLADLLMANMLHTDPQQRASVQQCLEHPYFSANAGEKVDCRNFVMSVPSIPEGAVVVEIPVQDCGCSLPELEDEATHDVLLRTLNPPSPRMSAQLDG
jgi:serine/threonine-protein kinase 11